MRSHTKHTRRVTVAFLGLLLVLPLAACSALGQGEAGRSEVTTIETAPVDMLESSADSFSTTSQAPASARSVIHTGDITVEVNDPAAAVDEATDIASELGGYVEAQSVSNLGTGTTDGASVTLRVPAANLDEAFAALSELGSVRNEQRFAQDVTAQHVDLQARVSSLQTSIDRLTELMAGSTSTSELIEAESALTARQAELDGLVAQLEILEGQIDESTIYVSFTTSSALPGGPSNFWEGFLAGLNSLSAAAAGSLVLLGILLPWLILAGAIAFAVILLIRRSRSSKTRTSATQPATTQAVESPTEDQPAPPAA